MSQWADFWVVLTSLARLLIVENFAIALVAHTFYLDTFVNGVIQRTSKVQVPQLYVFTLGIIVSAKLCMIFWAHNGKNGEVVTETSGILILETIIDPKLVSIWYTF
jgi:hypothetical protein